MVFDPKPIVDAVRSIHGVGRIEMLPIRLPADAPRFVADCARDNPAGYLYIDAMSAELSKFIRLPHAVMVSSGTAALHLALRAVGVGPGDVVVVPALAFIAVANAVRYCGAQPLIAECSHSPFGAINAPALAAHLDSTEMPIKALIAVDMLGHRCVTQELVQLCSEFGIPIIEDAAAALGTINIGRDVLAATVSFNCNKIVTTGGGGAVLTDNPGIAKEVTFLATTAKKRSRFFYEHTDIGFNYRMPNICAALGCPQMGGWLDKTVARKRELQRLYLNNIPAALAEVVTDGDCQWSNYWLNAAMIDPHHGDRGRDILMAALDADGIGCRAMFTPLHMQAPYADAPRMPDLAIAEDIFRRTVCLPSGV